MNCEDIGAICRKGKVTKGQYFAENLEQNGDYEDDSDQGRPSGTTEVQVIQVQPKNSTDDEEDIIEQSEHVTET